MDNNIWVAFYLVVVLVVAFYKSRKVRTMRDYSVGDRNFSLAVMVATITATCIGGWSTLGLISSIATGGIVYILLSFAYPINALLMAQFLTNHLEKFSKCISVGDIMEKLYGKNSRIISGICAALYGSAAVAGQITAIGFIVQYFLNIPYTIGVLISCGVVIIYSSFGGIKAVTSTDVIQFAILIIAIPMVCNVGLNIVGGYEALINKVPKAVLTLPNTPSSIIKYSFMFSAFSLPFLDPPQVQRMLMAKNGNQMKKTLRIDALIELPFFIIVGIIGLIAVAMDPNHDANLAFPHLINSILPFGIRGFAIIGLLSVVMSTADSYLNSSGISLIRDAVKPLYRGGFSDKNELLLTQLSTFVIGVMATIISLNFKTILDIILFSLNFWAPIMIVPLSAALMGINAGARSFYVGACSGVSMFLFWHFLIEPIVDVDSLFPSILANAFGFWISYRLSQSQKGEAVNIHQPLSKDSVVS